MPIAQFKRNQRQEIIVGISPLLPNKRLRTLYQALQRTWYEDQGMKDMDYQALYCSANASIPMESQLIEQASK